MEALRSTNTILELEYPTGRNKKIKHDVQQL